MNSVAALLPHVRQHCRSVPDFVLRRSVVAAAQRFFKESRAWTEKQTLSAFADSVLVHPEADDAEIYALKGVVRKEGGKICATFHNHFLMFNRAPNCDVVAEFVLLPTGDAENFDFPSDFLVTQQEAFVHAAVRDLKTQQDQPWFDPNGAMWHEQEYRHWLGISRIDRTADRVRIRPFA